MNPLRTIIIVAALAVSAPAMAQQYGNGGGFTNIWSSAQGTSNSYGGANAFSESASAAAANAAGSAGNVVNQAGVNAFQNGALTTAITSSYAGTQSFGGGYAQTQTSGYAGGTVSGSSAMGR